MNGLAYDIARRFLVRANRKHLAQHPQLVCFSFDLITQFIHLDGRYENDELTFLAQHVFPHLPDGGTCLDLGANIGNHAVAFAPHFDRVIAFEPHPRTFRLLQLNAELAPNVTALNLGLSDKEGKVRVSDDRLNMAATSIRRTVSATEQGAELNLVRLDDLQDLGAARITFVKIDVEGHERPALEGAKALLQKHKPLIVMEVLAEDVKDGRTEATEFLRTLGYQHFYELTEAGWLGRLPRRAKKAARSLLTLLTGRRPSKASLLQPVADLEKRSYLMLLCATEPLSATRP